MSEQKKLPIITGLPIDVVIADPADESRELSFLASVSSVKESTFHLTFNCKEPRTTPPTDAEAPFPVLCRMPKDTFLWSFQTRVIKAVENIWVLTFPDPEDVLCEQRREHVRAIVNLDGSAAVVMAGRFFGEQVVEVVDVSGGGCQLASEKPFIQNAVLRVKIELPDRVVFAHGKVIRASAFPQRPQKKKPFLAGVTFTEITPGDRECLIKYVFDSMRKGIQQGRV